MKEMPPSPFNVPEGFFDAQRQRILERLKEDSTPTSRLNQTHRGSWMRAAAFWIGLTGVVIALQQWNAATPCQSYSCLLKQHEPSLAIPDDMLKDWLEDGTLFDILLEEV